MLFLKVDLTAVERGPGVWILNNSHLDNKEYIDRVKVLIEIPRYHPCMTLTNLYGGKTLNFANVWKHKCAGAILRSKSMRQKNKIIRENNTETLDNTDDILEEVHDFYSKLYIDRHR